MMKKILKEKYIIIIFLVTSILFYRLFITPRYYGHDTIFHTANIIELSKTINITNILGSKIITFPTNKFGYGTWLFYPKLPHLLGAYLYKIFKNVYTSMDIVYYITSFLSAITVFFLSKKIFKSNKVALLSAIIYLSAPYHICEIYIRDAFAENFMFLAAPLIFLGLYNLLDNNYKNFYIFFILGYVIGMYSHLVSMVFCTIFVALFLLYYHKKIFKKEKIKAFIISTLIVIGLTLPFLITVIEYKSLNAYTVFLSETFTNRYSLMARTVEFKDLYKGKPIYDSIMPYFNLMTIVFTIITTFQVVLNKTKYKKELVSMLIYIIIIINLVCSKKIWENVPEIFLMLQFPWRLIVFLSMFVAIYAPTCILKSDKIPMPKNLKKIIYSLIICLILIEGVTNVRYYSDICLSEDYILSQKTVMGYQLEYLPLVAQKKYLSGYRSKIYMELREDGIITDNKQVKIKINEDNFPNMSFKVTNLTEKTTIELPRIYYLGYVLTDESGNKIKLKLNKHGFLEATISKNGNYKLYHSTTIPEKISNLIAIITILLIIIYGGKYKNEK